MSASQILPVVFSPIVVTVLLTLVGAWTRRRIFSIAAAGFLLVMSLPGLIFPIYDWHQGFARKTTEPSGSCNADVIVVLAGAMTLAASENGSATEWGDAVDRILGGVSLWQKGCAPQLVLMSGVQVPAGAEREGDAMRSLAERLGVPAEAIQVLPLASNTEQEAAIARASLDQRQNNIILVTSAFHMRRAGMLFRERGFFVSEYPVDIRIPPQDAGPPPWVPNMMALNRVDIMIRETLGYFYYQLKIRVQSY